MTIVYGQIESLKRIKNTLAQKGIRRFNSLGEINDFKKNFEKEKQQTHHQVENELIRELDYLYAERIRLQKKFDNLRIENTNNLKIKIDSLSTKMDYYNSKVIKYKIHQFLNSLLVIIIKFFKNCRERKFDKIIQKQTKEAELLINEISSKINEYTLNREKIISERTLPKIRQLNYILEIVEGLDVLIAGAIGENLVEKELKKLSDKYVLFNDFSVKFNKPIYNRRENDRIYSIQIDHLLVSNSGIFILETKNWSKNSIENLNLRSPIEQIMRTEYALFVVLNSGFNQYGINLNNHHWGDKKIPIRNVIVMINNKPKEKFKYVQVKTLNELNSYIEFFEPIFDDFEVKRISEFLKKINN